MARPLCACHGEPMAPRGGKDTGWRCLVRKREKDRRAQARYRVTAKGRAARQRYDATPKGAEVAARSTYHTTRRRLKERIAVKAARITELEEALASQVRG